MTQRPQDLDTVAGPQRPIHGADDAEHGKHERLAREDGLRITNATVSDMAVGTQTKYDLPDIKHSFDLTEEQRMIQAMVRASITLEYTSVSTRQAPGGSYRAARHAMDRRSET